VSEWTSKRVNELCVTKDITCLLVYLSTRLLKNRTEVLYSRKR